MTATKHDTKRAAMYIGSTTPPTHTTHAHPMHHLMTMNPPDLAATAAATNSRMLCVETPQARTSASLHVKQHTCMCPLVAVLTSSTLPADQALFAAAPVKPIGPVHWSHPVPVLPIRRSSSSIRLLSCNNSSTILHVSLTFTAIPTTIQGAPPSQVAAAGA